VGGDNFPQVLKETILKLMQSFTCNAAGVFAVSLLMSVLHTLFSELQSDDDEPLTVQSTKVMQEVAQSQTCAQPILTSTYRSIQLDKLTHENIKHFPNCILRQPPGKFHFRAATAGNSLKKYPLNNFSAVQPIFTVSILIDSTQQAQQNKNIKMSKISY
jgi:hypothetical protein